MCEYHLRRSQCMLLNASINLEKGYLLFHLLKAGKIICTQEHKSITDLCISLIIRVVFFGKKWFELKSQQTPGMYVSMSSQNKESKINLTSLFNILLKFNH